MREALVALLQRLSPEEMPEVVYVSQGLLRPEYEGVELGVADSLAKRAVAQVAGVPEGEVTQDLRTSGDLGTSAEKLLGDAARAGGRLTVTETYGKFMEIARASGAGSQEKKVQILVDLLQRASPGEAKYLARFVLGKLRLGVREMTILDALAVAFGGGTKEARTRIEGSFNVSSDLGLVAQRLAEHGLDGLEQIRLTVGRPIRPMLSERSPDLPDVMRRMGGKAALEYKYDGLRVQAHVPAEGEPTLFSRRLENISAQFPELLQELPKALKRRPTIVEGECVAFDPDTDELRPFQEISRRRGRKHELDRMVEEVPVRLFLFDILLEKEEDLTARPFPERRARLSEILRPTDRVKLAIQKVAEDVDAARLFFDQAIADGCEGIMAKSLSDGSVYRAGARGFWWIKYKREYTHQLGDSIDGVVVGGFHGRGRRAGVYGALLLAVYNPKQDRFESFTKVGTGFDDATLAALPKKLKPFVVDEKPPEVETGLLPDVWMRPGLVLEVRGAELSLSPIHRAAIAAIRPEAGLALRFPRFTGRFRDDKGPTDCTTSDELLSMYQSQVRKEVAAEPPDASA